MKLLLDQNVSRRLVRALEPHYPGTTHLWDLAMTTSTDADVWHYARLHGFTVLTKDWDFREMAHRHGAPPQVIHLDVGNCSTDEILRLLVDNWYEIDDFGQGAAELQVTVRAPSD